MTGHLNQDSQGPIKKNIPYQRGEHLAHLFHTLITLKTPSKKNALGLSHQKKNAHPYHSLDLIHVYKRLC